MTLVNETVAPQLDSLTPTTARPATDVKTSRRQPAIADNGKVRLGAQGAVFRRSIATHDTGKVRIGAQRIVF